MALATLDEPLEPRRVVRVLEALGLHDPLDEEGVVAAVAQLHRQVVEGGACDALRAAQQQPAVLLEDGAVARLGRSGTGGQGEVRSGTVRLRWRSAQWNVLTVGSAERVGRG